MIGSRSAIGVGAVVAWLAVAPPAMGQDETDQRLGTVHFPTSCNETAQRRFDRGMRYQHSFWYRQSKEIFEEVLKADPECAIAYWGIALSLLQQSACAAACRQPARSALRRCRRARRSAPRRSASVTTSTRSLVLYTDYDKVPHGPRVQAYLKAMEALAARYPDDDEAQIFYAITLNVAASPNDKTYANQLKGAAILEPIFKRQPRHPGVAHYLIHLYDTPALAEKGLDAARRYAGDRAGRAARAAHAVAHLHARRLLEGVDRIQHRRRARRKSRQGIRTINCTPWTTWSMPICSLRRTRRRATSSPK